jgi:signal peptidase I
MVCLSQNEYFVLGDNSPLSQDSRAWRQGPGVPQSLLVGRPFVVHLPSRSLSFHGLRLQVPDLARVRPIR